MQQTPFIDLFKSVLHISGDNLAHLREYFLTAYTVKKCSEDVRVFRPKHVELI